VRCPPSVGVESSLPLSGTSHLCIYRWRCLPLFTKNRSEASFVGSVLYMWSDRSAGPQWPPLCWCRELATSKLYISSMHIQMAVPSSRHEEQKPSKLRLLCPLHVVVSCSCGPIGTQVRSGLSSVGVESSLPLSYTSHLCISRMLVPSSGHEEQKPSKLRPSRVAARLLCPVHDRGASVVSCVVHVVR
jgi:hypothetical protein